MSKLDDLVRELAQQNAEESIGDLEEVGISAMLVRGNLLAMADEYGYEIGERLQEKLQGMNGAIVYASNDEVSVETFEDDDALDEQWGIVAATVESSVDSAIEEQNLE